MRQNDAVTLRDTLSGASQRPGRWIWAARSRIALRELATGSTLGDRLEELRGRSVLLLVREQQCAGLALIQIDGVARRVVICPPDLDLSHLPHVIEAAQIDAIVSDRAPSDVAASRVEVFISCSSVVMPVPPASRQRHATEWLLFTSGTSGMPKMVSHTLSSLAGAIENSGALAGPVVWSTFYDIRRYGGLQIFLRALLGGGSLVLSDSNESTAEFLERAGSHAVTHISGTPSHWRRALMSGSAHRIAPQYVRLSGEIADQAILDALRTLYPSAIIAHAFASTEAGVGFEVEDGLAGIPASYFESRSGRVQLRIEDRTLRIRSGRTALCYVGNQGVALVDSAGYVDTGDLLELREGRYHFIGRREGIINVGGLKVHPEEIEAIINRHPRVQISRVKARKNPVTGAVVVAEIVLKSQMDAGAAGSEDDALKIEILQSCQRALAAHKVPAAIRIVRSLDMTPAGKVLRSNA